MSTGKRFIPFESNVQSSARNIGELFKHCFFREGVQPVDDRPIPIDSNSTG
jgi:hypothetical protein